jgi:hypothetical protein
MIGKNAGILIPIRLTVNHHNPRKATLSKIHHEDIFPNNLIDNDTTLAKVPIMSRKATKSDIMISPILAQIHGHSMSPLPVIGKYSLRNFLSPRALY